MLHKLPFEVSEALQRETDVHRTTYANHTSKGIARAYPTAEDYCRQYVESPDGAQLRDIYRNVPAGARVLDIGVGPGFTSVYLALLGYRVSAVEPSLEMCEYLEKAAQLYGLPLTIYNVTGESLDRLPERDFDVCQFHASLHHCDEPLQALKHCHTLLKPGGRMLLINEPILQFYRSKAWFEKQLAQETFVGGHYGGNEHIYYYSEYFAMLRQAGFTAIRSFPMLRYLQPESYFKYLSANSQGQAAIRLRRIYYRFISLLCRTGPLGQPLLALLKRASLVQTNFLGTKRTA